jgi:hypothetical protein
LLLGRCLKKDPKYRYHDIADVRVDIQEVLADPGGEHVQPVTTIEPQNKLHIILPWVAAAIVVAGVAVWILKPLPAPEPKEVMRSIYELPEDQQFGNLETRAIAISPDGTLLAYATPEGIYRRSMDHWTAELLHQTEGAANLFFSPDGRWIGFVSPDGKLMKIAVSGGAPRFLANLDTTGGISWTDDNRILRQADLRCSGFQRKEVSGIYYSEMKGPCSVPRNCFPMAKLYFIQEPKLQAVRSW